jgi:hypothetical protein
VGQHRAKKPLKKKKYKINPPLLFFYSPQQNNPRNLSYLSPLVFLISAASSPLLSSPPRL